MGMKPSLAALDDASVLKQKEWSRGEPGEDTPQMYSTIDGRLTPTSPAYEDMRTDTTLNETPEESLGGLPAAVGGIEERENTQQTNDDERALTSKIAPPAAEILETSPKVINERSIQEGSSRRNGITRETSREDALVVTRHFFNTVHERRNVPEVPVSTTTGVSQIDTSLFLMILLRPNPLNQKLCLLKPIFSMDHHLDPLLQLLADLKHGYNVYQREKLKSIPERMRTH